MSGEQSIKASIYTEWLERADEVVDSAVEAGLSSPRLLRNIGIILGSARPEDMGVIAQVEGIKTVEPTAPVYGVTE